MYARTLWLLLLVITNVSYGLDSDQEQPATLEANDFELDMKTGVRTYRGNVVYRQGSIRLDCDELVTEFNADGDLDKAVCTGDPGTFKQRPEDSDDDMVGKARKIVVDQVEQIVILKSRAEVNQGGTRMSGRLITYNLETEKVIVKGDSKAPAETATASAEPKSGEPESTGDQGTSSSETSSSAIESEASSRPTLIIQPRKKKDKN